VGHGGREPEHIEESAMSASRWVAGLLFLTVLGGCGGRQAPPVSTEPPLPGPGADPAVLQRMVQMNPDMTVGTVVAVRPQDRLVSVEGIGSARAAVKDTVVFYAGDQVVNTGEVVAIVNEHVHVLYAEPGSGRRAPVVSDVAIAVARRK
jgi:hypothetical protein